MKSLGKQLDKKLTVPLRWVGGLLFAVGIVIAWRLIPATFRSLIWDLIRPTDPTEFWTMIAGLASALLVLLAWRGLRSLGLTKSDMLTRAVRDSRESAVRRCEEFGQTLITANAGILTKIAANKVPVFVQKPADVQFDPDNLQHLNAAKAWVSKIPQDLYGDCIALLNALEGWAPTGWRITKSHSDHARPFFVP